MVTIIHLALYISFIVYPLLLLGFIFYDGDIEETVLKSEDVGVAYLCLVVEFAIINDSGSNSLIFKLTFDIIMWCYISIIVAKMLTKDFCWFFVIWTVWRDIVICKHNYST